MLVLSFDPISELPSWLVATIFGVPFIGGLIFYTYKTRHAKSWRKGIFPFSLKPTDDNFLEAFLALGAKLILINYAESKGKTTYLNNYFNRYFKFSNYNFGDSLLFSLKYPIQTKSVTDWLKLHYKDESSRSQVVYFLTGLTLVTGSINKRELAFLMEINSQLELPPENLKQINAIYASYSQSNDSTSKTTMKSECTTTFQSTNKGEPIGSPFFNNVYSVFLSCKQLLHRKHLCINLPVGWRQRSMLLLLSMLLHLVHLKLK